MEFYLKQGDLVLPDVRDHVLSLAKPYVVDWFRVNWADRKKVFDEQCEKQKKAKDEKEKAKTSYDEMNPSQVLFGVLLQQKSKGGQVTIDRRRDPLLAMFVDNNPEIKKQYNVKFGHSRTSSRGRSASSRSNDSSRRSSRPSSQSSRRSSGKGKSKGKGKGKKGGKEGKRGIRDRPGTPIPSPRSASPHVSFKGGKRKKEKKKRT